MVQLSYFDIYGSEFRFRVFGKKSYQTNLGFVCTILTVMLAIFFAFVMGSDFFYRKDPKLVSEVGYGSKRTNITEITKNFQFFFGNKEESSIIQIPNFIKANAYYHLVRPYNNSNLYLNIINKEDWIMSIEPENNTNKQIFYNNQFDQGNLYIDFTYVICNETIKTACTNRNTWEDFSMNNVLVFNYPEYFLNISELTYPLQTNNQVFAEVGFYTSGIITSTTLHYKSVLLDDDQDWIFKNSNKTEIWPVEWIETSFYQTPSSEKEKFLSLILRGSNTFIGHRRSFMKLQELWIYLSSFLSPALMAFRIILNRINQISIKDHIIQILGESENQYIKSNNRRGLLLIPSLTKGIKNKEILSKHKLNMIFRKNNFDKKMRTNVSTDDLRCTKPNFQLQKIHFRNINKLLLKKIFCMKLTLKGNEIVETYKLKENFVDSFIDLFSYIRSKTEVEQLTKAVFTERSNLQQFAIPSLEEMKNFDELINSDYYSIKNDKDLQNSKKRNSLCYNEKCYY
jgi:hypothetical protein